MTIVIKGDFYMGKNGFIEVKGFVKDAPVVQW